MARQETSLLDLEELTEAVSRDSYLLIVDESLDPKSRRYKLSRLLPFVNVKELGAVGDGVTDDTAKFEAAMALSNCVIVPDPDVAYLISSTLAVPANTRLVGEHKRTTKLLKGFNGTMMTLANGAGIENLYLEGAGTTRTGKGIEMTGEDGRQLIRDCNLWDFDDACIYFEVTAGSQCVIDNVEAYRYNALTGTGRYAIVIEDAFQDGATPRKILNLETSGRCGISFGGSNNTFVGHSVMADVEFSMDSRGVHIVSSRILNQTALTVRGHGVTILACSVLPQITIASGSDSITIGPGSFNDADPITDSSGIARNFVDQYTTEYTPEFTTSGDAPDLGDGQLVGSYTRCGSVVSVTINFQVGSTTTLGTGTFRFSLPFASISTHVTHHVGSALLNDVSAATNQIGIARLIPGNDYVDIILAGVGSQPTALNPWTWANGDIIRLSITYPI